jgi:hypothetical protein
MIFFDIDETLINQKKAEAVAVAQLLSTYGNPLDRAYSGGKILPPVVRFARKSTRRQFWPARFPSRNSGCVA